MERTVEIWSGERRDTGRHRYGHTGLISADKSSSHFFSTSLFLPIEFSTEEKVITEVLVL